MSKLIIHNIGTIFTSTSSIPLKGSNMDTLTEISNAFIVCNNEKIEYIGIDNDFSNYIDDDTQIIDANGMIAVPGFIDGHTHLCYGGSRENELNLKLRNIPYLDILKNGGGILSTVNSTRLESFDSLVNSSLSDLDIMLLNGVTTVEAKSGYGLDLDTEIKQLEVYKKLNEVHPIDIVSTFMPLHAIPSEFKNNKSEYLDKAISWLDKIKENDLASFVDVFCEDSVFNVEESKKFLEKASSLGFGLKIHADEICNIGASMLAKKLNAISADHLLKCTKENMIELSKSDVICNLLPFTSLNLGEGYANAREMINENLPVAISSDYNPGSAPNTSFLFVMQLSAIGLRMYPNEILNAVTINASHGIKKNLEIGTIEISKKADIVLLDAKNLEYIFYRIGKNHVHTVIKNGVLVVDNHTIIK